MGGDLSVLALTYVCSLFYGFYAVVSRLPPVASFSLCDL